MCYAINLLLQFIYNKKIYINTCHTNTAVVKDTPLPQRLEMPSFVPPKHLDLTIYPTEVGVSSVSGREAVVQMLSTAIKITLDPKRNVKARLNHIISFWLFLQLVQFWC